MELFQNIAIIALGIALGLTVRRLSFAVAQMEILSVSVRMVRNQLLEARQERDRLKRPTLRNRELMRVTDDIEAGKLRNGN